MSEIGAGVGSVSFDGVAGHVEAVRVQLSTAPGEITPHRVAEALRAAGRPVGDATVLAVYEALRRDVVGAGPLDPLLHQTAVTDVLVNGPAEVYVDRGAGLERADVRFPDEAAVRRLAQRLVSSGGRRLDDAAPYADVRLRDGTRCHAVLAPLARPGTAISLRVPRRGGFTLDELHTAGTLTDETLPLVQRVVASRRAFLITGGTGSGKTTLLAALLSEVDAAERIVVVEDATELRPAHPHVVGLEARPANLEGHGHVALRDLVRQALRMRPDRLVVGEVRDAAVVDLLAALNTGHEGGCGTLHANSAADLPARIEALALAAGLGREAAHSQLAAAIDVALHLTRSADGRRRLSEVGVLERDAAGLVRTVAALTITADGRLRWGPAADRLADLLER
jgi:pilus assembly protein CpaF